MENSFSTINEKISVMEPKLRCSHCGFVQEYHESKTQCPKCGQSYFKQPQMDWSYEIKEDE